MGLSKKRSGKIKKEECLDEGDFSSFLVPKKNKNLCPAIPTSNEQWHGKTHLVSQNPYSVSKSYCESFALPFFSSCKHICRACFCKDFHVMLPNHLSLSLSFLPSELADDMHMDRTHVCYQMV